MKLIMATAPGASAREIGEALLRDRLVACVSVIGGVKSRYWWKGEIEESDEVVLLMKTRDDLARASVERLAEVHPYEVPEAIVLDVEDGHRPYIDWVAKVTSHAGK